MQGFSRHTQQKDTQTDGQVITCMYRRVYGVCRRVYDGVFRRVYKDRGVYGEL